MRRKRNPQTTIFEVLGKHPGPRELEQMANILATNHDMLDQAYADLLKKRRHDTGRQGMTAEQVVRCALLKQFRELSYDDLAYYLADSHSFRSFVRLEPGNYPAKSTLQENIKALSEDAWLAIHHFLLAYAQQAKIENRFISGSDLVIYLKYCYKNSKISHFHRLERPFSPPNGYCKDSGAL